MITRRGFLGSAAVGAAAAVAVPMFSHAQAVSGASIPPQIS
jgi:hypothetical protein